MSKDAVYQRVDSINTDDGEVSPVDQPEKGRLDTPLHQTRFTESLWPNCILILLVVLVAVVALILWILLYKSSLGNWRNGILDPFPIGGQLTYNQAKAVDFACSAVLGPAFMVCMDKLWFAIARSSATSAHRSENQIRLSSLVLASNTGSGSFNPFTLSALFRGGNRSMVLFAVLAGFSGIAGKMVNSFIAYQAFETLITHPEQTQLRLLSGAPFGFSDEALSSAGAFLFDGPWFPSPWSNAQQGRLANQLTALLTLLNFQSSDSFLEDDGSYIGINATAESMNDLSPNVIDLYGVPIYRSSIECVPASITNFSATQMGPSYFTLDITTTERHFQGLVPGDMPFWDQYAHNYDYPFVAFDHLDHPTHAFLGTTNSFTLTGPEYRINSSYGVVVPTAFNVWSTGDTDNSTMTVWGVDCIITDQTGLASLSRYDSPSWYPTSHPFTTPGVVSPSILSNYQTSLKYTSPISSIMGLGPALTETAGSIIGSCHRLGPACVGPALLNFTTYAHNFLYASAEARRITYNVVANDTNARPDLFYSVTSTANEQYYQITYIPLLLLLAIVTLLVSAVISLTMASRTRDTISFKTSRDVDSLRLLVDAVAGLQGSASEMAEASTLKRKDLGSWANDLRVGYAEVIENGRVTVQLLRSDDKRMPASK